MKRPTIFISSTIYDFRDLRSALKDYLELRGCQVLASDHNDFVKNLDQNSYDACLDAIEKADLFVLLIGSRVGGLVDQGQRISITRSEYRRAYELAKAGRLKLLCLVRTEVFNHRESIKDMQRFLEEASATEREKPIDPVKAPTKFMTDAEAIIDFIEEVSRNRETIAAVKGDGEFPKSNWLHQFSTFPEVRQQLDVLILGGLEVSDAAGRLALLELLKQMLRTSVALINGKALIPKNAVLNLVQKIGLHSSSIFETVQIPSDTWSTFVHLITLTQRLNPNAAPLLPFLSTSLLLNFDSKTSRFETTAEHQALAALIDHISEFNDAKSRANFVQLVQGVDMSGGKPASVPVTGVVAHLGLLLRWVEMAEMALALAKSLGGQPFVRPLALPRSPLLDQEAGLAKEAVTGDHIELLLQKVSP